METYTLTCEKRNITKKAKALRREGFVPASVYGPHIDPISIQASKAELAKYLHHHTIGSKVLLNIEGKEQLAIFKESQRDPLSHQVIHISFQALTSGEKVKVAIPIIFKNKDAIGSDKVLQEVMSEIEISALPKFLIEHVEIDVSEFSQKNSVLISDLSISDNKDIEILSPKDAQVCIISHVAKFVEEPLEEKASEEEPAVSDEPAAE